MKMEMILVKLHLSEIEQFGIEHVVGIGPAPGPWAIKNNQNNTRTQTYTHAETQKTA